MVTFSRMRALAAVVTMLVVVAGMAGAVATAQSPAASVSPPAPTPTPTPVPGAASYPPHPTTADLAGSRPDIVLVVLDDMPDIDDRVYERLPTIRRLFLEQGVRFTDFIGNDPLCCPSRATILTGLTALHHGVTINYGPLFDDRVTIATELQAEGYATLFAGKYFNVTEAIPDKHPPGWTHALVGSGGYWEWQRWLDGEEVPGTNEVDDYSVDVIRRQAVEWLAGAPADRPLFLELAPFAVHGGVSRYGVGNGLLPFPATRHAGDPRCDGIRPWRPPGYNEIDVADKPGYVGDRDRRYLPWEDGYPLWAVCETLLSVDEAIAEVESALAAAGRTNVLLIFTDDNGMTRGAHRLAAKRTPYSVDLPFFVHWPAALGTAPRRVDELAANIDIAPTICALAGCTMGPFANGRQAADGVSLLPLLTGETDRLARAAVPIQSGGDEGTRSYIPAWVGIRTSASFPGGRQLYVEYTTGEREHYDLARDPWLLENDVDDPAIAPLVSLLDIELDAFFTDDHAPYGYDPTR